MPRSRPQSDKRALARIQRLCCLGIGSEMLMPDLLREVMALVHWRSGQFVWVGANSEIANFYGTFSLSDVKLFFQEFYRTRRGTAFIKRFSDRKLWPTTAPVLQHGQTLCTDHRTFLRSDLYNILWRPADIDEPVRMIVREPGPTYGVLSVYRAAGEAPFEPGAVNLLTSIVGFMAHAMTSAELTEDAYADSDDRGLLIVDLEGSVRHADTQTQHLLMMALNPRWSPASDWCGSRGPASEIARTIQADLVIDASGRGTLTLDLPKSAGQKTPEETSIGMDIG